MTSDGMVGEHVFHSSFSRTVGRLRTAIVGTVLGSTAWLSFTLLYLGFWAHGFSWLQNLVVILTSLVLLFGIIVAFWVSYGLGHARRWADW